MLSDYLLPSCVYVEYPSNISIIFQDITILSSIGIFSAVKYLVWEFYAIVGILCCNMNGAKCYKAVFNNCIHVSDRGKKASLIL